MKNNRTLSPGSGSVGVTGLLQVAFIVLKLCKVIGWSWWWVLSPTWVTLAMISLVGIIAVLVAIFK